MHMEVVGSVLTYMNKLIMSCDKHIPRDTHVVEFKMMCVHALKLIPLCTKR